MIQQYQEVQLHIMKKKLKVISLLKILTNAGDGI